MNTVYIATSLDGKIADRNDGIEWLDSITFLEGEDMGYGAVMDRIDALVMGRNTFETVLSFDVEWPYQKPVFVLSSTLTSIPESHIDKAYLLNGDLKSILKEIHSQGYQNLYIDGGKTIQKFLQEDLIDEMIITTFPVILGGGPSLFSETPQALKYNLKSSKTYFDHLIQSHFERIRD